ncbi:MAG: 4Fe-4S dicluster domain-containing protein [Lysobacterales bacterium]|nr:MAG: 4Fe-4S dicluster domain-containing protein [Xanthomonadales bacterium]
MLMNVQPPVHFDHARCTRCALCEEICPRHVPETTVVGGQRVPRVNPKRAELCIRCGHCVAICPRGAVRMDGISAGEHSPSRSPAVEPGALQELFTTRRSVRRFKDAPVTRDHIDRVVTAALSAPSAAGSTSRGIITVTDPTALDRMMREIHRTYEGLMRALGSTVGRFFVRRYVGPRRFRAVTSFVQPALRWYLRWYREGERDEISRGAPAVMVFHGPIDEPSIDETCMVMATHGMLMATAIGVGSLMNGMIPPACNQNREVRDLIGIPEGHEAYISLCLGYPRYQFRKTIRRPSGSARYV